MYYDSILDKIEFEVSKAKVKVTVAVFKTDIVMALAPSFMDRF